MGTLFVSVKEVVDRMQINADLDGVEDTVKSALTGAHEHVIGAIPSALDLKTHDLWYHLDDDAYSGIRKGGRYYVVVPDYFIRSDRPLVLKACSAWGVEGETIPTSDYEVQYEKGCLFVDEKYGDSFLHLTCTTGFLEDAVLVAADPDADPPVVEERGIEPIPSWVKEAILAYVGVIFDTQQTTNRAKDTAGLYKEAAKAAMYTIESKLRARGFAYRALNV